MYSLIPRFLLGLLLLFITPHGAVAIQLSRSMATESLAIILRISQVASVTTVGDLHFGLGILPDGEMTLTVDAASGRQEGAGGGARAAEIALTGLPSEAAEVFVSSPVFAINGETTLRGILKVSSPTVIFPTADHVFIGGTVDISSATEPGTYLASARLTVLYQ